MPVSAADLRDGEDDEEVEAEALDGAGVVRGDGAGVPDELAAADDEGLAGDVGEAELQEHVREVGDVGAGPERGDRGGEAGVHVEAGLPRAADGERVEEERVHRQRGGAAEQDPAVPALHALAPRVQHGPEQPPRRGARVLRRRWLGLLRLDRHERGPSVGVPVRRVHLVAGRGVERRHPGLRARVALPGRAPRRPAAQPAAAASRLLVPRHARAPPDSTGTITRSREKPLLRKQTNRHNSG